MTDTNWYAQLTTLLQLCQHRALLVLQGDADWRQQQLQWFFNRPSLWVCHDVEAPLPHQLESVERLSYQQLSHRLGSETENVLFSSETGLDANALAQAAGMVRAGGVLCLSLDTNWQQQPNPSMARFLSYPLQLDQSLTGFNQFLAEQLKHYAFFIKQNDTTEPSLPTGQCANRDHERQTFSATADQKGVIGKIYSVAFGHRRRPLLITADRGRGKSATLGMAALEMLKLGKQHILLTAGKLEQTQIAFNNAIKQAETEGISVIENRPGLVIFQLNDHQGQLKFAAPDDLIYQPQACDLLLVDEAAHLPMPMLQALVNHYPRLVMATTEQGYEGSGRSFKLRFKRFLDQTTPDWKASKLSDPIRWQAGDPLEASINQTLLFASDLPEFSIEPSAIQYRSLDPKALPQQPDLLNQIFQLLVTAHYQTSPNDLMQLLETPNQQLWVAEQGQQLIGVLFALEEGQLDVPEDNQRYQGHLLPQLLWKQTHQQAWLRQKTCRIVRIAIWPQGQQQGIGSQLLTHLVNHCQQDDFDTVSTSFGATADLIGFWQKNGFKPLHLGAKRDKASSTHSLAMALPLSDATKRLTNQTFEHFQQQFHWNLPQLFQNLSTELLLSLLNVCQYPQAEFPNGYLSQQPYEAVSYQLDQWTISHPQQILFLPEPIKTLWLQKVCLQIDWQTLVNQTEFQSRKTIEKGFKETLKKMFE